jgi:pimeloyl-ACP methyl ester carboxylesterase
MDTLWPVLHPFSTPVVVFSNGRIAKQTPAGTLSRDSTSGREGAANRLVTVWAADIVSVLDELGRMNKQADGRFAGRLDMNRIGVLGHSFGGAASAQACSLDDRCKAGIDLDGSLHGPVTKDGVPHPFLFLMSDHEPFRPPDFPGFRQSREHFDQAEAKEMHCTEDVLKISPAGYRLGVTGMRHNQFTDAALCFDLVSKLRDIADVQIGSLRALSIARVLVREFFDKHLKNIDGASLIDASASYPEVRVEYRNLPKPDR